MITLKNLIKSEPKFWHVQIIGWLAWAFMDFFALLNRFGIDLDFHLWIIAVLVGFFLTVALRFIYKYIRAKTDSIINIIIIVCISSLIFGCLWIIFRDLIFLLFGEKDIVLFTLPSQKKILRLFTIVIYQTYPIACWSLAYFGIKYRIDLNREKDRSQQAELLTKEAQLRMLRYQINPHFLFNSLNSVQALFYQNPKQADEMISSLSDFLRYNLNYINTAYISIREEIALIKQYLEIEKVRFEEQLIYKIEVSEEAEDLKILTFLIQPFVENAVKHGMTTSFDEMQLSIIIATDAAWLNIEITNTGKWIENPQNQGIGIKNVNERLINAYQDNQKLDISHDNKSVIIKIKIKLAALIKTTGSSHILFEG